MLAQVLKPWDALGKLHHLPYCRGETLRERLPHLLTWDAWCWNWTCIQRAGLKRQIKGVSKFQCMKFKVFPYCIFHHYILLITSLQIKNPSHQYFGACDKFPWAWRLSLHLPSSITTAIIGLWWWVNCRLAWDLIGSWMVLILTVIHWGYWAFVVIGHLLNRAATSYCVSHRYSRVIRCRSTEMGEAAFLRGSTMKGSWHTAAGVDASYPLCHVIRSTWEDVLIGFCHRANSFFGLDLHRTGWLITRWGRGHVQAGRLVQAVHVALHFIQQPLLLTFRDAAKTHS